MLKKGLAWHYKAYDRRAELDKVIYLIVFKLVVLTQFQTLVYNGWLIVYAVGERGSGKTGWVVGSVEPWDAMGLEKR